jgi:coenzyme PQQ precursor peptide PqqA
VENKQPPEVLEPDSETGEKRAWFPPNFEDFETAMEITAYVCRR